MPIYSTPSLSLDDERVPETTLAYYRLRLQQALHGFVLQEFNRLVDEKQFTQRALAERIDKDPARISHWLTRVSNFEFDTFSDLMVGMAVDPRRFLSHASTQGSLERATEESAVESSEARLLASIREQILKAEEAAQRRWAMAGSHDLLHSRLQFPQFSSASESSTEKVIQTIFRQAQQEPQGRKAA